MTRHSVQPRDRLFVNGYGILSFAKTMSKNISQKIIDHAKQSANDALNLKLH